MKDKYIKPELEMICLDTIDVIRTSGTKDPNETDPMPVF